VVLTRRPVVLTKLLPGAGTWGGGDTDAPERRARAVERGIFAHLESELLNGLLGGLTVERKVQRAGGTEREREKRTEMRHQLSSLAKVDLGLSGIGHTANRDKWTRARTSKLLRTFPS
jgi:hypothetical protein